MLFPLSRVFDADDWRVAFEEHWNYDPAKIQFWNKFNRDVVKRFEQYHVPVIELGRDTPKEAVCQVFEKVNTGGVTLTVFELLTATFAADGYELRKDWQEREKAIRHHRILGEFSNTDLLQAVTLLATWDRRKRAIADGLEGERAPAVGCRRADMLKLTLDEYQAWAPKVMLGLERSAKFLHGQHFFDTRFLAYGSQLIPLSAIFGMLGNDWDAHGTTEKIARWFWSGVFGELYGGTTETRFSRDLPEVIEWLRGGPEPRTVVDAVFSPQRLTTLRSRGSAAYKGVYALLLRQGARDWRTGKSGTAQNYFDERMDIHHIFPQAWCRQAGIAAAECDSIVNKTPLSARTNRVIGGRAPSEYAGRLQNSAEISPGTLDSHVATHFIDPRLLRADQFPLFFEDRKRRILDAIGAAMGKPIDLEVPTEPEEAPTEYEPAELPEDIDDD